MYFTAIASKYRYSYGSMCVSAGIGTVVYGPILQECWLATAEPLALSLIGWQTLIISLLVVVGMPE